MSMRAEQQQTGAAGGLSLELTKYFDAKPERVFDAWLGEDWGAWLPPAGATAKVKAMDPKTGGSYLVGMTMPGGHEVEIRGSYVEVDRPRKLVLTWIGNYNNQETLITVMLKPEGDGTLMTLRQEGFQEEQLREAYMIGWRGDGGAFDKLASLF